MSIATPTFTRAMIMQSPWVFGVYSVARLATFMAPFAVLLIEQRFFNELGISAQTPVLWWVIAAYTAVTVVRLSGVLVECWTNITFRYHAMGVLQLHTVAAAFLRPAAEPAPVHPAESINRLRDDAGEVADFPLWLPEVIGTTIATVCAFAVMWTIDARLSILALAPLIVHGLVATAFWRSYLVYRYAEGALNDTFSRLIGTIVKSAQTIQLLGMQSTYIADVRALGEQRKKNALRREAFEQLASRNLVDVSIATASAIVLWYAIPEIALQTIGVGDVLVLFTGLSIVATMPQTWATFVGDYAQQKVSIERLVASMPEQPRALIEVHQAPADNATATPVPPLVQYRVQELSYHHTQGGGVSTVSFTLQRGSLTVLTGRVGSGKTTLLNLCAGLLAPQQGTILWNTNESDGTWSRAVVAVPQQPFLFSAPLRDNITFGATPEGLADVLTATALDADIADMTEGLDTAVGPRGMRLSGGQRQRVGLARALLRRAELLVLDDVTSALDVVTEAHILRHLADTGTTILASSNRPAVLAQADTVIVIEDGQIIAQGSLAHLLASSPPMQALWADWQSALPSGITTADNPTSTEEQL
ncbi:MAG: ATP-binding cassette domain-containing protein [Roseiflexaceae bacterium]